MYDNHTELTIQMAQAIGRIEGKLDSLCGPEGRVTKLENAQTRQWWFTVAIGPALAILHGVARKFGLSV